MARFEEIEGDVWMLAAERTKSGVARKIPLTAEATAVVEDARAIAENDYLFASYGGKPLSDAAMAKLMKDHGHAARPHGFRSSFRSWAEDKTEASFELKETCLGHKVDTGVVEAYQRSDRMEKRRTLLENWSNYVTR